MLFPLSYRATRRWVISRNDERLRISDCGFEEETRLQNRRRRDSNSRSPERQSGMLATTPRHREWARQESNLHVLRISQAFRPLNHAPHSASAGFEPSHATRRERAMNTPHQFDALPVEL